MNKDYMKESYKKFSDFIQITAARQIQYLVLDLKYSEDFNKKMKIIVEQLRNEGREDAEISVMFDTNV